ncbi:WD40 repeat-like protein [Fistulina hepatica ATCC 64428]|uniref:WD40 repeat-like protein n=1 Tax=Fistulina hepatica ATCC 64428 TaxID=1128425 RepID=A0A0D7A515_9AGAR|nr:WD40 repeat-like protein [Fistulina hepatica ATCC 64428]
MSGFSNTTFGKRLRTANVSDENRAPSRLRKRVNVGAGGVQEPSRSSMSLASIKTNVIAKAAPTKQTSEESLLPAGLSWDDRFLPSRDAGDLRTSYNIDKDTDRLPLTMIPSNFNARREEANEAFSDVLREEVIPSHPSSPTLAEGMPYVRKRKSSLFSFKTPNKAHPIGSPKVQLDKPTDETYSLSPVRNATRIRLERPRCQSYDLPTTPFRVLDAPSLMEDFYLNILDWSATNVLAVGLEDAVYLWRGDDASVTKLCDFTACADSIASVSWVQKGSTLAVGTLSGRLHLYDGDTLRIVRTYDSAHDERIGVLAWNDNVLSSGSRDHLVYYRDVREQGVQPFRRSTGHRMEVCGLRWNDAGLLASGGNDNRVCIWDVRGSSRSYDDRPLWKFEEHTGAVKALAWAPHVRGLLASGGGTNDRHIRFWNTGNGRMLEEIDTGSQICNLGWSQVSHELVSTHGYASTSISNQICVWKYAGTNLPGKSEIVRSFCGHLSRVLYLAMSPDGQSIVTGAGGMFDSTLRFWHAFHKGDDDHRKGKESKLDYSRLIR